MFPNLVALIINDGAITEKNPDGFNDKLVEAVKYFVTAEYED